MDPEKRLLSLDTLRGFDMMFIIGFASIVVSLCSLFPGGEDSFLAMNMSHAKWDGLFHHDTIFPLFLFIAGISWPYSFAGQKDKGKTTGQICLKVVRRGITLCLLGLVYNRIFELDFSHLRIYSVLMRIGLAWMFSALIFIFVKKNSWRAVIAAVILLGYWALLQIPAPDYPDEGSLSKLGNIVGYVDRQIMPGHLIFGEFDPEGLLSTFPAIVTAMLGMFTGEYVRNSSDSGNRKSIMMFLAAAVLLAVGLLWSTVFPINKKLWTSTFVLVVGAYSLAMFALFYWVIDVKMWRGWTKFFQVIGVNSITIYLGQEIIDFYGIDKFFLGGLAGLCPEPVSNLILSCGYLLFCWLFLWFLYRHKVFLKV